MSNSGIVPVTNLQEVISLLEQCDLPIDDISPQHPMDFFGIRAQTLLIGVAGLEFLGSAALLRSIAVSGDYRENGIGSQLVEFAEAKALAGGVKELYLLTDGAQGYFERLGYESVNRAEVPGEIRDTDQFADICPVNAACMIKRLGD